MYGIQSQCIKKKTLHPNTTDTLIKKTQGKWNLFYKYPWI